MVITKQAEELENGLMDVATKLEVLCPQCGRDVDESELAAGVCNDCGADLSEPVQNVELHVTSIPLFAITF